MRKHIKTILTIVTISLTLIITSLTTISKVYAASTYNFTYKYNNYCDNTDTNLFSSTGLGTESVTYGSNYTLNDGAKASLKGCRITSWTISVGTNKITQNAGATLDWSKIPYYSSGISVSAWANFTRYTYTISYNSNGGAGTMDSERVVYRGTWSPKVNLYIKTGYTFSEWNRAADGSGWITYTPGTSYISPFTEDVTLYAQWTPNVYTVNYNSNGGEGTMDADAATYNSSFTPKANTFTKTGYTFTGWNTTSDGSGSTYTPEAATTWKIASNTTLYAQWSANTYTNTLTYDANGGTDPPETQTAAVTYPNTQSTFSLSSTVPVNKGYTFEGWYTSATDGTKVEGTYTVGNTSNTGNQSATLYAHWKKSAYTLSYNLSNGTLDNAPTSYTQTDSDISIATPEKSGYKFNSWTENISTTDWTNGYINEETGESETNETYPNSVYSEKILLKQGSMYSISGTSLGNIRLAVYSTDGTYLGSTSDTEPYIPEQDVYVNVVLYDGCTEENRNAIAITSLQYAPLTISTGSTGNRTYTANFEELYTLTVVNVVQGNGGNKAKDFEFNLSYTNSENWDFVLTLPDGSAQTIGDNQRLPTFSLKNGEQATFSNLTSNQLANLEMELQQVSFASDGYDTTFQYDQNTETYTIVNTKTIAVPTGNHNNDAYLWLTLIGIIGIAGIVLSKTFLKHSE